MCTNLFLDTVTNICLYLDMPMYPPVRRRNDSHGSGTESQDNDGKHDYERDPRAWQNYPVPPHPGQYIIMNIAVLKPYSEVFLIPSTGF